MTQQDLHTKEFSPEYKSRLSDVVIQNRNNATIILGLDREVDFGEDASDIDNAQAGTATIDLVVGRETKNPNFDTDSARVLITSKAKGDSKFGLTEDEILRETDPEENSDGNSYVVVKGDSVRIIARDNIRIQNENSGASVTLKSNGDIVIHSKEDIKIGSDDATEPVVLGERLKSVLETLIDQIVSHTHIGNMGAPTSPPVNAAGFTSLKAGTISNKDILADNVFSEKNNA